MRVDSPRKLSTNDSFMRRSHPTQIRFAHAALSRTYVKFRNSLQFFFAQKVGARSSAYAAGIRVVIVQDQGCAPVSNYRSCKVDEK